MLYFVFSCWLFIVSFRGLITSVVEERANLSAIVMTFCGFFSEGFPLPLSASEWLRNFIVALPWLSIKEFFKNSSLF